MNLDDALIQYQKCYACEYFGDCPYAEQKIKDIINNCEPFPMPKPTNPLNPFKPYKSKYFIDRRYDPPSPLTDIWRHFERRKNEQ